MLYILSLSYTPTWFPPLSWAECFFFVCAIKSLSLRPFVVRPFVFQAYFNAKNNKKNTIVLYLLLTSKLFPRDFFCLCWGFSDGDISAFLLAWVLSCRQSMSILSLFCLLLWPYALQKEVTVRCCCWMVQGSSPVSKCLGAVVRQKIRNVVTSSDPLTFFLFVFCRAFAHWEVNAQ